MLRIGLANSIRSVESETKQNCLALCETMENLAREENKAAKTRQDDFAQAVHAAYATVLPPNIMLTEDEKVRAFDRLRAKLYPNGQDPFGGHRRW